MANVSEKDILLLLLSLSGGYRYNMSSVIDILYRKFGNLYGIVNASEAELISIKGMSRKKIEVITSMPSILEYYLKSKIISKEDNIDKYKDVIKYFMLTLRDLKFEMFSYAIFDIKKHVIDIENIFRGSISSATVYPREIIEIALSKGASYIVVAHNHPSGLINPSDNDIVLTEALYNICCSVDITLIDHIIIAKDKRYSFRKKGIISFFKKNLCVNNKHEGGNYA